MPRYMCLSVSRDTVTGFRHVRSRGGFSQLLDHTDAHTRPCSAAQVCRPFLKPVLSLLLLHKRQCLSSRKPCLPYELVRQKILQRETKTPEPIRQVVSWASLQNPNLLQIPDSRLGFKSPPVAYSCLLQTLIILADSSQVLSHLVMKCCASWSLKYWLQKASHDGFVSCEAFDIKLFNHWKLQPCKVHRAPCLSYYDTPKLSAQKQLLHSHRKLRNQPWHKHFIAKSTQSPIQMIEFRCTNHFHRTGV